MGQKSTGATPRGAPSESKAYDARPPLSPADLDIVDALRRGDEGAFERLVGQHHGALRRMARRYVSSPAVADEVVQDTWLAVIRGLWAFEGRSSLKTWIFRILINRAKTQALRERRTVPFADLGLDDGEVAANVDPTHPDRGTAHERHSSLRDPDPSPEAILLSEEASSRIQAAIDALPANQRSVITMRDVEGWSSEEVCNVLDLSETNQRVILHRARSRVRSMLSSYRGEE